MDLGIVAAVVIMALWAVITLTTEAPEYVHLLLTIGFFLLFWRVAARESEEGRQTRRLSPSRCRMEQPNADSAPSCEPRTLRRTAVAELPQAVQTRRDKPVVVTGASGFVGTRLCKVLADDGWKVRAIVRDTAKAAHRLGHLTLEIRAGDIRDLDGMRAQ